MKLRYVLALLIVTYASSAFAENIRFELFDEEMISGVTLTEEATGWCALYTALIEVVEHSRVETTVESVKSQLERVRDSKMAQVDFELNFGSVTRGTIVQDSPFGRIEITQVFESPDSIILESMSLDIYGADICKFTETNQDGERSITKLGILNFLKSL